MTREQFILGQAIAGVVIASNPPFCSENIEQQEVLKDPDYIKNVAEIISDQCSVMMIQDMIEILECAEKICEIKKKNLE